MQRTRQTPAGLSDVEEYIHDEMNDSAYYARLAELAPDTRIRSILLEISKDELSHAESLTDYYAEYMRCAPKTHVETPYIPDFMTGIEARIEAETGDMKKYAEKITCTNDQCLKQMLYIIQTDEARHAIKLLFICVIKEGMM